MELIDNKQGIREINFAVPAKTDTKLKSTTSQSSNKFYTIVQTKQGREISINHHELLELLKSFGFRRYDLDNLDNFTFIKIDKNIVQQVEKQAIIDAFFEWLNENHTAEDVSLNDLKGKIYKGLGSYFNRDFLARLTLEQPLNFLTDQKDKAFFYFRNGIITVTAQSIDFQPYSEKLNGYLWKNQILDRDFTQIDYSGSLFENFCYLISNEDNNNYISLSTILGYLLHDYKAGKRKAINFTDSSLNIGNNGRSGKTMLSKSLENLRIYKEINGKDFRPDNKFKYQECNLDAQVINLNDVTKHFELESVYNDITEKISVEGKNKKPFHLIVKMIICSNRPLEVDSGSDKDRVVEFALSDFFSNENKVEKYYGKLKNQEEYWFFRDFDTLEWHKYDNYMLSCMQNYLKYGIQEPINKTLNQRKLINQTHEDFILFIDGKAIQAGVDYDKKALFNEFINKFENWKNEKFTQNRFTVWLRKYAELSEKFGKYETHNDTNKGICYFKFLLKN